MSKIFKITYEPDEFYGTPLDSDTLFGHICWAIRYNFGEDKLVEILDLFNNGNPPFLVSSSFPEGYLPKPTLPPLEIDYNKERSKKETKINRQKFKKQKKISFIKIDEFIENQSMLSSSTIFNAPDADIDHKEFILTRNAINRETMRVIEGALFTETYYYLDNRNIKEKRKLWSFIRIEDEKYKIDFFNEIFKYLSDVGIGKDKSTGKGRFIIKVIEVIGAEKNIFDFIGTHFFTLSHTAGANLDPIAYTTFTRYGKLGEEFSTKGVFYKKPIMFYKHGSIFVNTNKNIYGETVKNISTIENVIQYGYAFPLYFNFKENI